MQDDASRIRSRRIGFAVHHFNLYTTEDLLTMNGLITRHKWRPGYEEDLTQKYC